MPVQAVATNPHPRWRDFTVPSAPCPVASPFQSIPIYTHPHSPASAGAHRIRPNMKLFTPAAVLSAALLPLAARAVIPLIDDLVKKESWSYVPVRPLL